MDHLPQTYVKIYWAAHYFVFSGVFSHAENQLDFLAYISRVYIQKHSHAQRQLVFITHCFNLVHGIKSNALKYLQREGPMRAEWCHFEKHLC